MFDDPAILLCGPVMCHVAAGQPAAAAPRSLPQPVQSAAGTPRPTSTTAGTAQPVVGAAQKPPHAARAAPATAAAGPSTAAGHASQFDVTYQRRPPTAGCPSSTSRALRCCLRTPTAPCGDPWSPTHLSGLRDHWLTSASGASTIPHAETSAARPALPSSWTSAPSTTLVASYANSGPSRGLGDSTGATRRLLAACLDLCFTHTDKLSQRPRRRQLARCDG
jgi:hypothetical protein